MTVSIPVDSFFLEAYLSAVRVAVFLVSFLGGFFKSMFFREAADRPYQLKSVYRTQPGWFLKRFRQLAAMLLDDATAGDSSGDLVVGKVACLDQKVAYYEDVQRGFQKGSHDGARETMSGKQRI